MDNIKPWDKLSETERAQKVIEEFERTGIEYSFGPGGIKFDGFVDSEPNDLEEKPILYIDENGVHIKEKPSLSGAMWRAEKIIEEKGFQKMMESIPTKELFEELMKRIAVDTVIVYPHEKKDVTVEGPAIVLLVYD